MIRTFIHNLFVPMRPLKLGRYLDTPFISPLNHFPIGYFTCFLPFFSQLFHELIRVDIFPIPHTNKIYLITSTPFSNIYSQNIIFLDKCASCPQLVALFQANNTKYILHTPTKSINIF